MSLSEIHHVIHCYVRLFLSIVFYFYPYVKVKVIILSSFVSEIILNRASLIKVDRLASQMQVKWDLIVSKTVTDRAAWHSPLRFWTRKSCDESLKVTLRGPVPKDAVIFLELAVKLSCFSSREMESEGYFFTSVSCFKASEKCLS